MEGLRSFPHVAVAALLVLAVITVKGQQISTPCSPSMISTFTPCLNFITGSSGNGASPSAGCCDSLKSLMSSSMDCTCLIITGGVPFSLPSSTQLAISLPRICKTSMPIQCKASGFTLPSPGPALFAPSPPPVAAAAPLSPRSSKASALPPVQPPAEETIATPEASPSTETLAPTATSIPAQIAPPATGIRPTQIAPPATGIRPVVTPQASASNPSSMASSVLLPLLVALLVYKLF